MWFYRTFVQVLITMQVEKNNTTKTFTKDNIMVRPVITKRQKADFIKLPSMIYKRCEQYVPDLESDVKDTFRTTNNAMLESSDVQPFIAYDENGSPVGRVVGIINHKANEKWKTLNVRFGLIEFVDDRRVSDALLSAVEQWGHEHGMKTIQGPMGIFDFDKEGMLVEDFDMVGSMVTIYNLPYYPVHLEALGYTKEVDWVQIRIDVPAEIPKRYARVANTASQMFGLKVRKMTNEDIWKRGLGKQCFDVLNAAYSPLFGYTELSDRQIKMFLERYMPVIDKRMLPVIENEKGEIVGVAVTLGSLSNALRKSKGRLFPFGWYHLLRSLKWRNEGKAELLLIAVRPDYQGLGVNALFFNDLIPVYNKLGYTWAETGPQLEDNVKELSQWKIFNPKTVKRRRCYTKEITQKEE